MHIGFFSDGYAPQLNGVAISLDLLARALEEKNQMVSIFAPRMDGYVDQRPRVYRFPSAKVIKDPPLWLGTPISLRVFREIPDLGLDIIHLHTPFAMQGLAHQVARRNNLPLVSTYHTLWPAHVRTVKIFGRWYPSPRFAEWYSVWTCNLCDHIIAPSEKIKALLEGFGVVKPISVIHNGIAVEAYQNQPRGYIRARLGLNESDRIILSVGRLTPEKNLEFLVDALAELVSCANHVYLVLVGAGPLRKDLERRAADLNIKEHLLFLGALPNSEMPQVYADADMYTSASLSEAHSLAMLEALAAGLAFVVVRDESLTLTVRDEQNGFVVNLNKKHFAACVLEVLGNESLLRRMQLASRQLALSFSVRKQADRVLQLYEELAQNNRLHS